jgi:hypothetical protein
MSGAAQATKRSTMVGLKARLDNDTSSKSLAIVGTFLASTPNQSKKKSDCCYCAQQSLWCSGGRDAIRGSSINFTARDCFPSACAIENSNPAGIFIQLIAHQSGA